MGKLAGLTILVPESRERDLFAGMLEAEGADVTRCPLVRILDLEDHGDADKWIDDFIADPFADLIFFTGEGVHRLVALSGARRGGFMAAMACTRLITRGPKPAHALRMLGLAPGEAAPVPTSQGLLALMGRTLTGRRVGVQLYPGEGGLTFAAELRARGAEVFAVTPYRYAPQADTVRIAGVINALAAGHIAMVAFTSSPQVERLAAAARELGLEGELARGLARARIASIGPVVTQTLKLHGVDDVIQPQKNFHLKPMIGVIAEAWVKP